VSAERNLLCESRFDLKPDCGGGGHGEVYSPYLRPSAEGPQMAIAQIEVQVKRNPMKTLAQIINRVNNGSMSALA
jgi:hypothetical protein